uniref:Fibroblast growth factor n=1 Tax=Salvator merianae TaxID=96440 RepID=A0A8D0BGJ7_SALMN
MPSTLGLDKAVASLALALCCFAVGARSLPLSDAGPHVNYGWGDPIRLRHLYTSNRHGSASYFLRISNDGRVDGTMSQNLHSLLEIRAVSVRAVAIRGVHSSLYLCMAEDGKLHGLTRYSSEDCSFEEELCPDGYNIYRSKKYGILVSLSSARQRQQFKGTDFLPLSRFLPMINTVPVESTDLGGHDDIRHESDIILSSLENMDPVGITSEVSSVKSLSFGK